MVMTRRKIPPPPPDLIKALCRINRALGRLGVEPICPVSDAKAMPATQVREMVALSERQLTEISRALRGYLG